MRGRSSLHEINRYIEHMYEKRVLHNAGIAVLNHCITYKMHLSGSQKKNSVTHDSRKS
jgi:hypothetical protein